jgi:hypothetical protein
MATDKSMRMAIRLASHRDLLEQRFRLNEAYIQLERLLVGNYEDDLRRHVDEAKAQMLYAREIVDRKLAKLVGETTDGN